MTCGIILVLLLLLHIDRIWPRETLLLPCSIRRCCATMVWIDINVCVAMKQLCWKSQLPVFLYFVNKVYLPCVVFVVVFQLNFNAISASYCCLGFHWLKESHAAETKISILIFFILLKINIMSMRKMMVLSLFLQNCWMVLKNVINFEDDEVAIHMELTEVYRWLLTHESILATPPEEVMTRILELLTSMKSDAVSTFCKEKNNAIDCLFSESYFGSVIL